MSIFPSSDIVNSFYMTSRRGHCFERNKESLPFHTNGDTSIVRCFAFLYFSAANIKFSLFISRYYIFQRLYICFPEICLVSYISISCVTLKLFCLFNFNKVCFLEWSRYLFNNTYIVRGLLVILYPC